ncbi:MAG: M14 family zinc carboxypeptidase [Bacteroidota bacterium]
MEETLKLLFDKYDNFKNQKIDSNRITHATLVQEIKKISGKDLLKVNSAGQSINGSNIFKISIGKGETKILAWSQMHGDEPTATASIFDLLNFFISNDEFNKFRNDLLDKLELIFIPMLNPDGAKLYSRYNSINIDINRDALRKESPESRILWKLAEEIKPEFGFNLHDQNSYYTAGISDRSAAISLLAPPINYEKTINETRKKSMQVISVIEKTLSRFIPGNIARYDDDFEPRAFGDNLTKYGISSILIESGFIKNDQDKDFIRKLNFISLLSAFHTISDRTFTKVPVDDYFNIPENKSMLFDLLLRNLTSHFNGKEFKIDIGINREKKYDPDKNYFYFKGTIQEVGDLSLNHGIEEYNLTRYQVETTQISDKIISTQSELNNLDYSKLHRDGFGIIRINNELLGNSYLQYPICAIPYYTNYLQSISKNECPNLIIKKNNVIEYIIINGFIITLDDAKKKIKNGLVIS